MKWAESATTAADSLSCLHWNSFEINTYKSQDNESVLVYQIKGKLSSLESDKRSAKHIAG